jgi:hypothetical protein
VVIENEHRATHPAIGVFVGEHGHRLLVSRLSPWCQRALAGTSEEIHVLDPQ